MALRDLAVVLDGTTRDDVVLDFTLKLARRHKAHVVGLCPLELLYPADLGAAAGGFPQLLALRELAAQLDERIQGRGKDMDAAFRERLAAEGVEGEWRPLDGPAIEAIAAEARTTDLVVLSQAIPDEPLPIPARQLVEETLMRSGRPLLPEPRPSRSPADPWGGGSWPAGTAEGTR